MKLSEQKELKEAILAMPEREKDKLLLRLIAKDSVLTEHLHFTLLEDQSDLHERVALILSDIEETRQSVIDRNLDHLEWIPYLIRQKMTSINHFYKVTKSDFDEVYLKLNLLNTLWYVSPQTIAMRSRRLLLEKKFAAYFTKQVQRLWQKFQKLHEDLQFDLKSDFESLLSKIKQADFLADEIDQGFFHNMNG